MKQAKTLKPEELKLVLAYIGARRYALPNRTIVLEIDAVLREAVAAVLHCAPAANDNGGSRQSLGVLGLIGHKPLSLFGEFAARSSTSTAMDDTRSWAKKP